MPETIELTFDTGGWDKTVAAFPHVLEKAIQMTALELGRNIRTEAPIDQGNLRGSWQLSQLGALEWALNSKTKYRWMVQTGTKAHEIRPVNAKALHFTIAGDEIFCKVVHHPGTAANPYITRAIDATIKRLPEFADKAVKEVLG